MFGIEPLKRAITGGIPLFDSSSLTLCFHSGKKTRWRLSFSCGRKRPTSDFGIAGVRTFLCNVFCRIHTRNDNSRGESRGPKGGSGPDWPGRRQKSFPGKSPYKPLSGIHGIELACQIVNLLGIKTDSAKGRKSVVSVVGAYRREVLGPASARLSLGLQTETPGNHSLKEIMHTAIEKDSQRKYG